MTGQARRDDRRGKFEGPSFQVLEDRENAGESKTSIKIDEVKREVVNVILRKFLKVPYRAGSGGKK